LRDSLRALIRLTIALLAAICLSGCLGLDFSRSRRSGDRQLTVSAAIGQIDATRDASLRLVIAGLDEDTAGRPARALANYQRAVRVDATNPFAFLALARHHLEGASVEEASAFLDQARSLFENDDLHGRAVDVWGVGLRAGINRELGRDAEADQRFDAARRLSPEIWGDERLSSAELR
jgi:tetratricopeptide (TPR) repeat protein